MYWEVPELWRGETCAIIGGGPSLTKEQVEFCRGRVRVIAINDAYLLAPWADILYFCDARWYAWHHDRPAFRAFAGLRVTLENPELVAKDRSIKSLRNLGRVGLCEIRHGVMTGRNSGYQCINLSVHLGCKQIILLGFDMKVAGRSHWFGDHPSPTPRDFAKKMLPCFDTLVEPLKRRGVEVLNATPGSALSCFPMMRIEDGLRAAEATVSG